MRMSLRMRLTAAFGLLALVPGCRTEPPAQAPPARPVSYQVLEELNPGQLTRLTGSVESWKKEMLAFRVPGRVVDVVEPGVEVMGRAIDAEGQVTSPGTLLAELESDIYQLQLAQAEAVLATANAQVTLARTELERTIPERIKAATANLNQKTAEFSRLRSLIGDRAVSKSEYDIGESEFRQAEAELATAQADQATKTAEFAALQAKAAEAEQARREAEVNLNDCELYSPFTGQVSKVHAIAGGYLQDGMPIVTVQLMDPMKVEIAVSQETDRQLRYNDQLNVYVDNLVDPISGFVFLKDTVADSATRTFNVTILVRNRLVEVGLPAELASQEFTRTTDLFNLESEDADGQPPWYVEERSVHAEPDGRPFVWKVEGLTRDSLRRDFEPVFTVRKVYVQTGEKTLRVLQLFKGVELTDLGELDPAQDLVTGRLPDGVQDGDTVLLSRTQWLLRPGQLVQVELKGQTLRPGFYVPRRSVLVDGTQHYVFVAADSDAGQEQARRIPVQADESIGDYQRIEATDPGQLQSGEKVILDGAHYLHDGDTVNAFERVEVSL
ncbi:MAG: efflux RND transporter periplasmic adaptor subunit [Planctomycetota bacterium]